MTWLDYLARERVDKLERIQVFSSGHCRLFERVDGVEHDITEQTIATLEADIGEIEQILMDEGVSWNRM